VKKPTKRFAGLRFASKQNAFLQLGEELTEVLGCTRAVASVG
jgi:hypothetical protein